MTQQPSKGLTLGGAAFLGIGAMVGAGIFTLLGEAGAVAGSAVWVSFLLGGIIATLMGYTVAKRGTRYPGTGGLVNFFLKGYGDGHTAGIALWLMYFSGLIVTAMVAVSFGSYAFAIGVFGTLTVEEVIGYGGTALAEAARPAPGEAGFVIMAIAALLATSSSVNANIHAAKGVVQKLAEIQQFPPFVGEPSPVRGSWGIVVSLGIIIVTASFFDLTAIASIGRAVAHLLFMLLAIAGFKLRGETASRAYIIVLAAASTACVLALFLADTLENEPRTFVAIMAVAALAVGCEVIMASRRQPGATTSEGAA